MSEEFRLKNIDETRNYFLQEIRQGELVSRKCKKVCTTLNFIEHFLILASRVTGCISVSAFAPLLGLKFCAIAAGIKRYKSIIKKTKTNHDKIVLFTKSKLKSIKSSFNQFKY